MMKMPMTVQRLGFYKCILFRLNTLHGMLVSCTSKNVIYGKTCAECGLVNKGETGDVQKTEQKQKQIRAPHKGMVGFSGHINKFSAGVTP